MCMAYVRLDAWHVMEATFWAVIKWTAVCTCDACLRCAAKVVGDCVARRVQRAVRFGRGEVWPKLLNIAHTTI